MSKKITPKAFLVIRRGNEILVQEGYDRVAKKAFFRPPGGKVEFGEYSQQTAVRELKEELGVDVTVTTPIGMLENIFTLDGESHHEILFIFEGVFNEEALYQKSVLEALEGQRKFEMIWVNLQDFFSQKLRLVPPELNELLQESEIIPLQVVSK
jgi:8-oxo-dGTP pyrophosphatase MutT (NUDIX family)